MVTLPIRRGGTAAKFGLDFKPLFAKIAGANQPGAYLIGMRTVDGESRRWLRVQVTDLTLSTIEESGRVRFAVTSLASPRPVSEAQVLLQGVREKEFITLGRGTTDADGMFTWTPENSTAGRIKRIVVTKGLDTLVLEPERGPAEYAKENWTKPESPWLSWTTNPAIDRSEAPRAPCHVFTERPIYRPEEPVHIKGHVRTYRGGAPSYATRGGTLVVSGPSKQEWPIPVTLDETGNFLSQIRRRNAGDRRL